MQSKSKNFQCTNSYRNDSIFQESPTCPTIQEQVHPDHPFKQDYITNDYRTYIKASGHYYNQSGSINSTVWLSCYYEGAYYIGNYYQTIAND